MRDGATLHISGGVDVNQSAMSTDGGKKIEERNGSAFWATAVFAEYFEEAANGTGELKLYCSFSL